MQSKTDFVCEESNLTLSCDHLSHINVIRANFGRFSILTCNPMGYLDLSVICKGEDTFNLTSTLCNRKSYCTLLASDKIFGDPCPATPKYLEVQYECIPRNAQRISEKSVFMSASSSQSSSKPRLPPPIIIPTMNPSKNHMPDSLSSDRLSTPPSISFNSNTFGNNGGRNSNGDYDGRYHPNDPSNSDIFLHHPYTTVRPHHMISKYGHNDMHPKSHEILKLDHCLPTKSRDLWWNYTLIGNKASQPCPGSAKGEAHWFCVSNGLVPQWVPPKPIFSKCHSPWMIKLKQRSKHDDGSVSVSNELSEMTRLKALYGGDIESATQVLDSLVTKVVSAISESPDERQNSQIVTDLLIVSRLLVMG